MNRRILCLFAALLLLLAGCQSSEDAAAVFGDPGLQHTDLSASQTTNTERVTTEAIPASTTEPVIMSGTELPETTTETTPSTEPAASSEATEPTEPTEPTLLPGENTAFHELIGSCDGSILGAVYNAPFSLGEPNATTVWNEGEFDRLVVYPRYVGSEVTAWQLAKDESGETVGKLGPVFSAVCADGDCIAAALDRPEGQSAWLLQIKAPDGTKASLELTYNGRYGTPTLEYLTNPSGSNLNVSLPEIEDLSWLEEIIGANALYGFLRAADRAGLEPWQAIYDYCEPLSEWDDSAAYTVYHGDMYEGTYYLELGRLRESYDSNEGSIADRLTAQYEAYERIGNSMNILQPGHKDGEALYVDLKGITVYNPTLLVKKVSVSVNGQSMGKFELTDGDFCTLIELDLTGLSAYQPVEVEVRVEESRCKPADAILEVWSALGGNISGAR